MKVNDLSEKIVISTGRIVSWPCVRALNSLQKAMMLMPCGPSAVPTGGAGLAFPAGIWSFTKPVTFFATALPPCVFPGGFPVVLPLLIYIAVVCDLRMTGRQDDGMTGTAVLSPCLSVVLTSFHFS